MTTATPPAAAPRAGLALAGAALCVLAALLIGFAANLTVVGHLQHARDQSTAYDDLREQLALGTAPVGQSTYDGKPLALGAPVALLRIPALGIREVVAEGTTSGVLMSGPGHRRDTALPGQAGASVIMGRQWGYGSPFNDVHRLPAGARVEVTTGQGKAVYEVTAIRRPGDPNPTPLGAGEGRLTLMTASGGAYTPEDVLRVDAKLIGDAQPSPARPLRPGWITAAEKPLAGESDVWPGIFLGVQALLAAAILTVLARRRWGTRQTWVAAVPVLVALGVLVSGQLTRLLPNLL
ncbi:class E sortase [Streptomyces sp. NBC_01255]|uniref:sortase n=1 Tax=Streptomyces sp. NBC_01255 TaxID=2903798 RepID=UPI002E36C462|nr:class E sortase [Streptomyces sp. NBC_01255]